jgi:hypothetical protein
MAHKSRSAEALQLCHLTQAVLAMDDGRYGENANGDRAWKLGAVITRPDGEELLIPTEWTVVLQDDALVTPDFRQHATAILSTAPPTAVSFYVGTGRPLAKRVEIAVQQAEKHQTGWLEHPTLLWGVGVAMPTASVQGFLTWAKNHPSIPYDTRIGTYWATQKKQPIRYTYPSLVDHADGPSLIRHSYGPPKAPRRAWRTGTPLNLHAQPVAI